MAKYSDKSELVQLDTKNLVYTKDNKNEKPLESLYLKKGGGAVQIRVVSGKRSLLQRKAINALFKIACDLGLDKPSYITTRLAFSVDSGFNSNDVNHLKLTAAAITDMRVEFDVMNSEDVRHVGSANLFSAIVFRSDGKIYFEIPELTKKMLGDDEKFALINMQVHADFDSLYAYILYEHCLLYISEGKTPLRTIDTWKEFLEIDNEQTTYHEFRYFNVKVIKVAVNEVNKVADILIEPVYHKQGRVVTHISFNVEKKPQAMFNFVSMDESMELEQKIVDFGVTEKVAARILKDFDRDRIIGNLEYVGKQVTLGKVDDPAGFLVKAITDDYRPKESVLVKKIKEEKLAVATKKKNIEQEKIKEGLKRSKAVKDSNGKAQTYFGNLDENEKIDLLEYFSEHLLNTNKIVHKQYKTNGLNSMSVKSCLLSYIKENKIL